MKSIPGMLEGAMAVRFYQSVNGPFPIEVGAAVPGSSMSAIIKPTAGLAMLDPMSEEDLGLSLLEAEATGLVPEKVCDQLNAFLSGRRVNCTSSAEVEAISHLFQACAVEREFGLVTLDAASLSLAKALPADQYPETIARDLFILAKPFEPRRIR
ncbi:hypothetical protein [Phytopseudomonas seleniipraecipitans]|jgi:hypothetical protein|uniref:Uncharacterized protein n=1 Tax=Phytopseudomonas seleniipraecipitans TaxID=640205 RepID=A0A1G7KJH6_9GAMM|nr:hypothetical protein [Pseudomonas seleniipraecipitans]SDF37418.1 hypothetical protein SAMN05216381_1535 [Pseudomonas seleniipraecipitans]